MALYCDESGGLSAGAMTFAAVAIAPADADAVLSRFRAISGLRGELKGSRITPVERGLLFEILAQHDVQAWVAVADATQLAQALATTVSDRALYSKLLDTAVAAWLPTTGGECADIIIDEGRYDPRILDGVRRDIQALLGQWGKASLADSRRCAGIQIADVIANSLFNLTIASVRARRIRAIVQPWLDNRRLRIIRLEDKR
jgi:Protein of unknown function (DUF3800)